MVEKRAFFLSVSIACLAMYLVYQYISNVDKELQDNYGKPRSISIVRAKRDILQYETIRPTDVEVLETVPYVMIPQGRITNLEDTYDSVAAIPINKGEFILDNKIISKNIYSGLDTMISREKRAISIPVNVKSAVGYLLRPGNRIDLAAHFEYKSASANLSEVKVFLQDLLILASGRTIQMDAPRGVDQNIIAGLVNSPDKTIPREPTELRETLNYAKTDANYQTVTLEVTPQQAQTIVYVMTVYPDSITTFLRHSDDRQLERMGTTNLYEVMGPDSYLVKGVKSSPPRAVPKLKFYDYQGGQGIPVMEGPIY
jgi:Flp pilus assembly protein CpaB